MSSLQKEYVDFRIRDSKPTQIDRQSEMAVLKTDSFIFQRTDLRLNKIETYDNMIMKLDTPSIETSFYDIHKTVKVEMPLSTVGYENVIMSHDYVLSE